MGTTVYNCPKVIWLTKIMYTLIRLHEYISLFTLPYSHQQAVWYNVSARHLAYHWLPYSHPTACRYRILWWGRFGLGAWRCRDLPLWGWGWGDRRRKWAETGQAESIGDCAKFFQEANCDPSGVGRWRNHRQFQWWVTFSHSEGHHTVPNVCSSFMLTFRCQICLSYVSLSIQL